MNRATTPARSRAAAVVYLTVVVLMAQVVAVGGCAHSSGGPPDVVRAFAERVARGQWEQAYALMSEDYQRAVPFETFRRDLQVEATLVNADALALSRSDSLGAVTATTRLAGGVSVTTTFERDAWRLNEQPLSTFGQGSPRASLRTFVRAVDLRRYDVLLRLVPARQRGSVTEASLRIYWEGADSPARRHWLGTLRVNLDAPIIDLGAEAYMPYGAGGHENDRDGEGEVRFLLEQGVWKIDDAR